MLIQLSIRNFKTFKEKTVLNMVASNYDKSTREKENIIQQNDFNLRLLKSSVIFGANASGKSKLIESLMFMKQFVIRSSKESQKGEPIEVEPFKLQTDSEKDSSEFEVIFIYKKEMFRYGFEVTNEKVISEWLYHRPKTKEVEIYYRDKQKFEIHGRNFSKGAFLVKEDVIRDNELMLSKAAQFNDKTAGKVFDWFNGFKTISGLDESGYKGFTMRRTKDPKHRARILELLKAADLSIQDISLEVLDIAKLPKDMHQELKEIISKKIKDEGAEFVSDVLTSHKKYDANKKPVGDVKFSMDEEESSGTRKFFYLTGPVLDSLENGYVLAVDELDSKLHPNLVCKLVSLFNSVEHNPNNAQLIFNTHDTNLLDSGLFRRDQIWFTEKDRIGVSKLFSLADFAVRKNENFEDNYIAGKYGAIPYLKLFNNLSNFKNQPENENEK
jgi:AAA15 family ATPase/GTPase